MFGDILVLLILAAIVWFVMRYLWRESKKGGCAGCSGCSGCQPGSGCPNGQKQHGCVYKQK